MLLKFDIPTREKTTRQIAPACPGFSSWTVQPDCGDGTAAGEVTDGGVPVVDGTAGFAGTAGLVDGAVGFVEIAGLVEGVVFAGTVVVEDAVVLVGIVIEKVVVDGLDI